MNTRASSKHELENDYPPNSEEEPMLGSVSENPMLRSHQANNAAVRRTSKTYGDEPEEDDEVLCWAVLCL